MLVGALALGLTTAGLTAVPAQAIDSNPPTGPGNIEVFPKRDMVAIEGYSEYAGRTATIRVTRDGSVIGSAVGVVDNTGFLEVNHPGGVCWGAGTGLKVTPDIKGGDDIRVDFADTNGRWDGAVTQDVVVTDVVRDDAARSLTIQGTYGGDVDMPDPADLTADPGRFGVEIVNPDMRNATSGIGERAIGWPVEADEVTQGYTVTGTVEGSDDAGGTFRVTYVFNNTTDLDLAEAGEVVGLAWQADAPVELGVEAQYGMTLYEFHEASGPGMGGCPASPDELRPNSPGTYTGKGAGPGSIQVDWSAATTLPSAPGITGYSVRAVDAEGNEVGKRVDAEARSATLTGLLAGEVYAVEIAARSDVAGESWAPSKMRLRASPHIAPQATANTLRSPNGDGKYAPLVTTANGDFGVHLDPVAGLLGAEVYYTVDGSSPTLSSPRFASGDPSLQIRTDTTVRWLVVDSGNITGEGSKSFDIVENAVTPPTVTKLAALNGAVDVTFGRVETAAAYRVQAWNSEGTVKVGSPFGITPTDLTAPEVTRRVTGLTNGTPYRFTVAARVGTTWSADGELSDAVAPVAPLKVDAGAAQTALRGRTVTLDGSASTVQGTYAWVQVRPKDASGYQDPAVTLTGADTLHPSFRFPLKRSATSDDGQLMFRLVITMADGTKKAAATTVAGQPDAVVATEARWRPGNPLRMSGTGSQENAVLTFRDATATGALIGTAVVINGAWEAPAAVVNLSNGSIHVWSDHGFVGTITTTP